MTFFPILAQLDKRRVVVIGGGRVASRKVQDLLVCNALVEVVAPVLDDPIRQCVDEGTVSWREKRFEPADLDCATLVFAATGERAVNAAVVRAAHDRQLLVNVVDDPELCDFILPAVRRRGRLIVAVSTSGASPALAGVLADELVADLESTMEQYLELIAEARGEIARRHPDDPRVRHELARALLESDARQRLQEGDLEGARRSLWSVIEGRGGVQGHGC